MKPMTKTVTHPVVVLLMNGIIVKIDHYHFLLGDSLEPLQGPLDPTFKNHFLKRNASDDGEHFVILTVCHSFHYLYAVHLKVPSFDFDF